MKRESGFGRDETRGETPRALLGKSTGGEESEVNIHTSPSSTQFESRREKKRRRKSAPVATRTTTEATVSQGTGEGLQNVPYSSQSSIEV